MINPLINCHPINCNVQICKRINIMGAQVCNATSVRICMEEFIQKSILKKAIKKKQSMKMIPHKVPVKCDTEQKRNETKRNPSKQNETY